jgi:enoyl-[acyl-carrier protein] reductase I
MHMLSIDLKGKKAFIAGIGDDQGFGWAIAKLLAQAGAEILIGTWAPIHKIFTLGLKTGKFEQSRKLADGSLLEFSSVYPMDATYDTMADVPEEIRTHKRYKDYERFAIADIAEAVARDHGKIDILIHSLANGPEVTKPLLETSRHGYLAAVSSSAYSMVSMVQRFAPHMNQGGAVLSLTYLAGERTVPGYGGGMSSAKAALESDTRTLAFEAGRTYGLRINVISAGPLPSRAARAIGGEGEKSYIEVMVDYYKANGCLDKVLAAEEVGAAATFLCSPLASAITGATIHVDNGLHSMAIATDALRHYA